MKKVLSDIERESILENCYHRVEHGVNLDTALLIQRLEDAILNKVFASTGAQSEQPVAQPEPESFQGRVKPWMLSCFGGAIANDRQERNHRFLEEALELVQSCGCSQTEAHQLVDYVFGRPIGEKSQEVGGVMVTLAALCLAQQVDMHDAGETELARIWTKVEQIRAKQAAKPKHSPLPEHPSQPVAHPEQPAVQPERVALTDEQISINAQNDCPDDWDDLRARRAWIDGYKAAHGLKGVKQ